MTDTGARALAFGIIEQAINDYVDYKILYGTEAEARQTQQERRKSIDIFFASKWFRDLVEMAFNGKVDPQYIIDKTKRKARAHDAKKGG